MDSVWNDRTTVKKGTAGESLVQKFLESKGLVVYRSVTDGAHVFDNLVMKNKEEIFIAEVKTKPARSFYPDTGFNLKHFNEYKAISEKHKLRVFIFFVDEDAGKIYGNYLHILEKERLIVYKGKTISYPLVQRGIIYFPTEKMPTICYLNKEQQAVIKSLSTSNYCNVLKQMI